MIVIQTTIDRRAMTALARVTRKTVRRGRNGPVRLLAWFVVLLELFLTSAFIRAGVGGWQPNALMGLIMLGCILSEDRVNGAEGLRRTPPESREVNTAFPDESCYVCRSQAGESRWLYSQVWIAAETEDYLVLIQDRKHGQVFDKRGLTWGTLDELRALLRKRTGLKIQTVR